MRIQKFIADCGYCSRRAAEELVRQGKVIVNNKPAAIGQDIDPEKDRVTCEGKRLHLKNCEKQYFLFYKPRGVITTMKAQDDRSVLADLIGGIKGRVYPVGRLDRDSEGLLILTDDGELANRAMHPRYHLDKTYRVTVKGKVGDDVLDKFRNGIMLEDGMTKPALAVIHSRIDRNGDIIEDITETKDGFEDNEIKIAKTVLHITISEGKNRQIRRMCEAVGLEILLLKRIAIGQLSVGRLSAGQYRPMTTKEKAYLLEAVGLKKEAKAMTKNASKRAVRNDEKIKHKAYRSRKADDRSVNEKKFRKQVKVEALREAKYAKAKEKKTQR